MENPTNNNGRPKLEITLNQSARVKLLKPKPFEGSSLYGSFHLYTVEHDGVEKAYFATEEVHAEIQKLGLKAGDEIVLTKIAHQNGRKIAPKFTVEVIEKKAESTKGPTNPDGLKSIMELSLQEAVEITRSVQGVPFQNEDIQKIASCLFIARTRNYSLAV